MRQSLAKIFTVVCFSSLFALSFLPAAAAANEVRGASPAAEYPTGKEAGKHALLAPPVGQRHIVLLRPIAPRSMPIEVVEEMKSRMERDFHVPLNETLRAVTYADEDEVKQAMSIIYSGDGTLTERIRAAAAATDADYIAGFVITDYKESTYLNWNEALVLHSYVTLHLVGYDRVRDLVFDLPAARSYHSEYSVSGTARILILFEIDRLMDKADFRSTLFPIADWLDQPREKMRAAEGREE